MMSYPHASVLALPLVFVYLVLGTLAVSASAEQISNDVQSRQPASIQITLSKQVSTAIRLEARVAPLGQNLNNTTSKTATRSDTTHVKPRPEHAGVRIQIKNSRLDLDARQASWREILSQLEQQAGVRFHYDTLPEGTVNLSFKGLAVHAALEKLFGSATGYAYRFPKTAMKSPAVWPKEVWIVGAITNITQSQCPQQIQIVKQAVSDLSEEQLNEAVQLHYQRELNSLLDKAKNGTPEERNLALVELSLKEDESKKAEIDALLKEGLSNEDADVRNQVLYGLASRGGAEAAQMLQNALHDESVGVRVTAVQALDGSNPQGLKSLQEAMTDPDETVRSIAESRLKEFDNAL